MYEVLRKLASFGQDCFDVIDRVKIEPEHSLTDNTNLRQLGMWDQWYWAPSEYGSHAFLHKSIRRIYILILLVELTHVLFL